MSSDEFSCDGTTSPPVSLAGDAAVSDAILESAGVGLAVFAPDSTVEHTDNRVERYFDFDGESATGLDADEFLADCIEPCVTQPDQFREFATQSPESGPESFECHVVGGGNRADRWLRCHSHPITSGELAGGRVDQYVDITAEKRVDAGCETILENFPNGTVTIVDETLRYQLARGEMFDGEAESGEDIEGKTVEQVGSGDREPVVESYRAALDGRAVTTETTVQGRDLRHRALPVEDTDGTVRAAVGMTRDITERKERTRELNQKRRALDEAPVGITITDPSQEDNPMVYANERFLSMTGFPAEAVLGRNCRMLQGEGTAPEPVAMLRDAIDAERAVSVDLRNYTEDGSMFWNRLHVAPVYDDADTLVNFVGFQRDVTDRKERQQALEESRTRYRTLVENFPNGAVTLVDEDLRYVTVGGVPVNTVNAASSDLTGKSVREVLPAGLAESVIPQYAAALDGEHRSFEESIDGREYRFRIVPVRDDDSRVFAAMGMSQDITEEKRRERALVETRERFDIALTETNTGTWEVDLDEEDVIPLGTITDLFGVEAGTRDPEAYLEQIHPADTSMVRAAFETAEQSGTGFDIEFRVQRSGNERWLYTRGTVLDDERGQRRLIGVTTDVTDRIRREQTLAKRERILRELHTATREFYPPSSTNEASTFIVEFLQSAFEFSYASVKLFDETSGVLQPEAQSTSLPWMDDGLGAIQPGDNPLWDVYRTGESQIVDGGDLENVFDGVDSTVNQALVAPIGDFGVTLALTTGQEEFEAVDADLVEVLMANAEAIFRGLRSEKERVALTQELSTQQVKIDELRQIVDTIQRTQQRVSGSETRNALEEAVCDELVTLTEIDFAWIGRPETSDTDLRLTASAGESEQYLDVVRADSDEQSLPARRAASDHEAYDVRNISRHVRKTDWAKEAVSSGFESVLSVPLLYDDILYGVLTVYSSTAESFTRVYENLLTDIASLSVNYSRMLEQRGAESQWMHTLLEFELKDVNYPLQRLARETDSEIQYATVAEQSDDDVTVIVTVASGDVERVRDGASAVTAITEVSQFGDPTHDRLALTIRKPFLATDVRNHGGQLVHSRSDDDRTEIRIELPDNVSQRPLLDFLTSKYESIELTAKEESRPSDTLSAVASTDLLTERQYEILKTAYHGGYYETPREVTGEDLASSFDISSPAVYNHLQAAHGTLLAEIFE